MGECKMAWIKWENVLANFNQGGLGVEAFQRLIMSCYKSGDDVSLLMGKVIGFDSFNLYMGLKDGLIGLLRRVR